MAITLNDNLQINAGKPVDAKYLNGAVDYVDVAEANSIIPLSYRSLGLTVRISGVEYWYQDSVQDSGLVIKGTGSDSSGVFIQSATTKSILPKSGGTVVSSGEYSIVVGGFNNTATGDFSFASGSGSTASGNLSHAIGNQTQATGIASKSEGSLTVASGDFSHSEGFSTVASGASSHAEGSQTVATGSSSHAEGSQTQANGISSHAEGSQSFANGISSHAEGSNTRAFGFYSHSEGVQTIASGKSSHAEGNQTIASGPSSHAEGSGTTSFGESSHAEGGLTQAIGNYSHAEGFETIASGSFSSSKGRSTSASSSYSTSEGLNTLSSGAGSHAEGGMTKATNSWSHAEGYGTTASGQHSHAEGRDSTAYGLHSHAQNISNLAFGTSSHAAGSYSNASGYSSFVHSVNSDVLSDQGSILGGNNNILTSLAQRSVVLGGQNITGSAPDTVYGINFNASGNVSASTIDASVILSAGTNLGDLLESTTNLTIEDEGYNLSSGSTNTINFIGSGVTAIQRSSGDGGIIDVYIPAFTVASHWGTNDGTTNGTVSENNLSRSIKRISTPNGGEGDPFSTGGWAGTNQSSSLYASNVTITSAEETTGFGGDSTMVVTVYSGDGSVAETYTTPSLNGNAVHSSGNITVTITDYGTDTTKFKAKASISVNIPVIFSNGGRYHIEVDHITDTVTDGGNTYSFVQSDVFYDTQPNAVAVGTSFIDETIGQIITKHISGVEYYIVGSQFTVDVDNIDYLNANTIRTNHNLSLVGTEYNLPAFNDLSYSSSNGTFSNYTQDDDNTGADYQRTDWAITASNQRRRSSTANVTATAKDAWDVGNASTNTANANILIDTFSDNSTDLNETFNGESQRYTDSGYTVSWDSTTALSAGDALVMGGQMMIPSTATLTTGGANSNWSSFKPNLNGPNPDYTSLNGTSSFFRKFQVANNDDLNNFSVTFTGDFNGANALADLQNEDIQIFVRQINSEVPGAQTGATAPAGILHGTFLYGAGGDWDVNQEGPLRTASSSGNNIAASFGAWPAKTGFLCEIRITNTNTKITSIQVTFNA